VQASKGKLSSHACQVVSGICTIPLPSFLQQLLHKVQQVEGIDVSIAKLLQFYEHQLRLLNKHKPPTSRHLQEASHHAVRHSIEIGHMHKRAAFHRKHGSKADHH
jgi:hypothetical protein